MSPPTELAICRAHPSVAIKHKEIPMTITTERRSFIQGAGLVAAAASTATLAASPAFAQNNQPSGARTMPYQAKPLSLDPKSIKGISERFS